MTRGEEKRHTGLREGKQGGAVRGAEGESGEAELGDGRRRGEGIGGEGRDRRDRREEKPWKWIGH